MQTYLTFPTLQSARDYRYENGTGGWIFAPDQSDQLRPYPDTECILFPPEFTPHAILHHPFTKGRSGKLISN